MADIGTITLAASGLLAGGGVWSVLRAVVRGRAAVALERQRAASVAQALERLPPGGVLYEIDEGGRFRSITIPVQRAPGTGG